jgi:hypothetical protein
VITPDSLPLDIEQRSDWERALAENEWPRVDATLGELCTFSGHLKSVWFDSFDDFLRLPGDDLTRAHANLRLGALGIEPLRLRPETGSARLLTPTRRWEYREEYYDEDRGLDIPFVPHALHGSPLSAVHLQLLDRLAAQLGETLVTYGIDLGDGGRTDRILGARLNGSWLVLDEPGAIPPGIPDSAQWVERQVDLVVHAPNLDARDARRRARDAWQPYGEWLKARCVHVETSSGFVTVEEGSGEQREGFCGPH